MRAEHREKQHLGVVGWALLAAVVTERPGQAWTVAQSNALDRAILNARHTPVEPIEDRQSARVVTLAATSPRPTYNAEPSPMPTSNAKLRDPSGTQPTSELCRTVVGSPRSPRSTGSTAASSTRAPRQRRSCSP